MNIFLFLDRGTWVHRLDPRTKITGLLIVFSLCLCFNDPLYMLAIGAGIFVIAVTSKSLLNFWRLRFILILLFFFSAVLWPLFTEGRTLIWSWGPVRLTHESLLYGIAVGVRLVCFVSTGLVLLSTTKNEELAHGLIRLGIPYPIAFAFSTSLRLLPTFVGVGATIVQAQMSRGLDLESGSIVSKIKKFIPQAVPLFFTAIRHTNLLAVALESRAFSPGSKRTFYIESKMQMIDFVVLAILATCLAAALYLRIFLRLGAVMPWRL